LKGGRARAKALTAEQRAEIARVAAHAFYNFVKVHSTLPMSPAMASGIEPRLWDMKDLVEYIDRREPPAKKRGPYKKWAA